MNVQFRMWCLNVSSVLLGLAGLAVLPAAALEVPFDNGTVIDSSTNRGFSTQMADLDGDGDMDALSAVSTPGNTVSWFENTNGLGTAFSEHTIASGWTGATSVDAGDVDGDGDLDVAAVAFDLGDVVVYRNNNGVGTSWTNLDVDLASAGPRRAIFADLDRDGDLDLAVAANGTTTKDVSWYENTAGDGSAWTIHIIDSTMNGARGIGVADVDADGDPDVVASAEFDDKVTFYKNVAGTGLTWTETQINTALFDGGSNLVIVDIDTDGKLDVAAVAEQAANCVWWRNTAGDGSAWTETFVSPSVGGAYGIAAADLDFDGDPDIVTAGRSAQRTDWWENVNGDGSSWTQHAIETLTGAARSVAVGDMNGDGWVDTILNTDGRLEWWRNESIHRNTPFHADPRRRPRRARRRRPRGRRPRPRRRPRPGGRRQDRRQGGGLRQHRRRSAPASPPPTWRPASTAPTRSTSATSTATARSTWWAPAEDAGDLMWWRNANGLGTSFTATTIDARLPRRQSGQAGRHRLRRRPRPGGRQRGRRRNRLLPQHQRRRLGVEQDHRAQLLRPGHRGRHRRHRRRRRPRPDRRLGGQRHPELGPQHHRRRLLLGRGGDHQLVRRRRRRARWPTSTPTATSTWWRPPNWPTRPPGTKIPPATAPPGPSIRSPPGSTAPAASRSADLDQDGDPDVVVTQTNGTGRVVAYDNVLGNGTSWSTVSIDNSFAGGALVSVADVDGDGRPDVLAAAETDGDLQWFRNGGGQVGPADHQHLAGVARATG